MKGRNNDEDTVYYDVSDENELIDNIKSLRQTFSVGVRPEENLSDTVRQLRSSLDGIKQRETRRDRVVVDLRQTIDHLVGQVGELTALIWDLALRNPDRPPGQNKNQERWEEHGVNPLVVP